MGWPRRGVPPVKRWRFPYFPGEDPVEDMPCLEDIKKAIAPMEDAELTAPVNIGLPAPVRPKERLKKAKVLRDARKKELEKEASSRKLVVPLDEIYEDWIRDDGLEQIMQITKHYGLFKDLFDEYAYFYSRVPLEVSYDDGETSTGAYFGNIIKPREATQRPQITYPTDADTLWTVMFVNPDGNLVQEGSECLHWLVSNIPGNDISAGDEYCTYLQPFPPKGVGFQRLTFILFKQSQKLDLSNLIRDTTTVLSERTFKCSEFYRTYEDILTPASLVFYQSDWDTSVTNMFHNVFNMKEPKFEYDWEKPYLPPQELYPFHKYFPEYLDLYRDKKEIAKELLEEKLKKVDPFKKPEEEFPYPDTFRISHEVPTWKKFEIHKERRKEGKYGDTDIN